MVVAEFLDYLAKQNAVTHIGVEDFADKFNFLFTVIIFILCGLVVTIKAYILRSIACYASVTPQGIGFADYVDNFCWTEGTYPIHPTQISVKEWSKQLEETEPIKYYQWVPFILGLQGILFYLPRLIWNLISFQRIGTDVQSLIVMADQAGHLDDTEKRQARTKYIATMMEHFLFENREYRQSPVARFRRKLFKFCSICVLSKRLGTWLFGCYIVIKILYLANSVGQLYIMQAFLGLPYDQYGFYNFGLIIMQNLINGNTWNDTKLFPRETLCNVRIKQVGEKANEFLAQCTLPINMLNEKIFIFLWFWIMIATILSMISIPVWLLRLLNQNSQVHFIKNIIKLGHFEETTKGNGNNKVNSKPYRPEDKQLIMKFASQFLRHDGVFLLRMMSINAGHLVTSEIVHHLWKIYKERYQNQDMRGLELDDDHFSYDKNTSYNSFHSSVKHTFNGLDSKV